MRFFLDNNLPLVWAPAVRALAAPDGHEVQHLRRKFKADVADVDWIRELAKEGNWVILSGDTRITRNQHEREAWLTSGLIAFFMGKSWRSHKFWEQTWRIVRWWPRIVEQARLVKPPSGFEIPINYGEGKFVSISLR